MLTRRPDRRPTSPADRLTLPVLGLLLRNQPAQVAVRTGIPSRPGRWQQPLGADPCPGVLDLGRHQRPDALIVPATLDPPRSSQVTLDDPLDGLVGDAAHLGGPAVGADLAVGGNDGQLLPRRQQWSPPGRCAVTGFDTATVTAQDLSSGQTRRTRGGDFYWPPMGTFRGHQWGLLHGHGHSAACSTPSCTPLPAQTPKLGCSMLSRGNGRRRPSWPRPAETASRQRCCWSTSTTSSGSTTPMDTWSETTCCAGSPTPCGRRYATATTWSAASAARSSPCSCRGWTPPRRRAAERLRQRVANVITVTEPALVQVTVSVGIAIADAGTGPAADVLELLAAADLGLYQAKAQGRDQVRLLARPDRRTR